MIRVLPEITPVSVPAADEPSFGSPLDDATAIAAARIAAERVVVLRVKVLPVTVSVPPSPDATASVCGVTGENTITDRQRPGVVNAATVAAAGIASF